MRVAQPRSCAQRSALGEAAIALQRQQRRNVGSGGHQPSLMKMTKDAVDHFNMPH
jgi:hypothetical protein